VTRTPPASGEVPITNRQRLPLTVCCARRSRDLRAQGSAVTSEISRRTVVGQLGREPTAAGISASTRPSPQFADTGGRSDGATWSVYYRPSASPPFTTSPIIAPGLARVKTILQRGGEQGSVVAIGWPLDTRARENRREGEISLEAGPCGYFFPFLTRVECARSHAAIPSRVIPPRATPAMNSTTSEAGCSARRYPDPSRNSRVTSNAVRLLPS